MLDVHIAAARLHRDRPALRGQGGGAGGTGNLPKFGENLFRIEGDDLTLIPTAEVPVTNLYRDEILEAGQLPIYHVAYTPCLRNEQMSAGRDVRGHQARSTSSTRSRWSSSSTPETSYAELETLIDNAEDICKGLSVPYRLLQLCTADLGTAAMKYDLELWAPGVRRVAGGQLLRELRATTRPAARTSATGPSPAPSPSSCTRSTARGWRCRA